MDAIITQKATKPPLLQINFISHGTLECADLQATRRFYEEVFGFEVIQHSPLGMMVRLGGDHVYVVLCRGKRPGMRFTNHNGLDVGTPEEVDRCYERLLAVKGEYGVHRLTQPNLQHGDYSFYFQDLDDNWWEILANPPRGYSPRFGRPEVDLTGLSAQELEQRRPTRG
jgi:predicted lactoylglutathione lyase